MFTTRYSLTSGAELFKFCFFIRTQYNDLKCQMPAYHTRLGNDCPKSTVCQLVDCLCAVGFKSTQRWWPAEDDLFH